MSINDPSVKIHKADLTLRSKIGQGPLDPKDVERCQDVIDNNEVDFAPLALEYLDNLEEAIKVASKEKTITKETIQNMTAPVMQLKANASTFHYDLIGNMANVMLGFLEGVERLGTDTIDTDVIAIVSAQHQTLKAIILKKMKGDGGEMGRQMEDEIKAACKRYFTKRTK